MRGASRCTLQMSLDAVPAVSDLGSFLYPDREVFRPAPAEEHSRMELLDAAHEARSNHASHRLHGVGLRRGCISSSISESAGIMGPHTVKPRYPLASDSLARWSRPPQNMTFLKPLVS